jgi:amino acid transporter
MIKLLLLMVLSSAAASTQTTILPTARTTLSMAVYKAVPDAFGKVHKRFLTPTTSTVAMGAVSIALYLAMNYLSNGSSVIGDSVAALGAMIAFYYGLTGFTCVWYYRKTLTESARSLWLRGILPLLGGLILWFCMVWFIWYNWVTPDNSYTTWTFPGTHRVIGGVFVLIVASFLLGVVLLAIYRFVRPDFFLGKTLNRDTPTRVPEDIGVPVGLFGIEPFADADGHVKNEPTGSPGSV